MNPTASGVDTGGVDMSALGAHGGNPGDSLSLVLESLRKEAEHGIAFNGILVWIDIQQRSTPANIWMSQAAYAFCDNEIDSARMSLWKAAEKNWKLIGNIIALERKRRISTI